MNKIELKQNVDKIAQYDFINKKVFGCAYYVYYDGEIFEKCYGTVSANSSVPITNTSIFRIASMSKPITAIATLILAERGLLSLDSTIDEYLPKCKDFKIISDVEKYPDKLPSIRDILRHTSGVGYNTSKLSTITAEDKKSLDSSIDFYIKTGLGFEPGSRQIYGGFASFNILTKIIEKVSGTDFLSFLKKEIFEPCKMVDTTFVLNGEQQSRLVDMHTRIDGENAVRNMPEGCVFEDYPSTHYLGGAGLVSTLSDYVKFAKMLLNKGKTDTGAILSEETFNQLCTPQVSKEIMPGNISWGLGVRVITENSYPYLPVGSFGWSGAYGSHFWVDPVNKLFAVFMKNSSVDGGSGNESAENFEKAVYSSSAEE